MAGLLVGEDIPRCAGRLAPLALRLVALTLGILAIASGAAAQSLLERSPNVAGTWVGAPGALHFNFLHRFTRGSAPTRKVVSSPTFLLAAGLPWHTLVGYNYSTNSDLTPRYPNEWEFFARHSLFAEEGALRADVGVQGGYNLSARSTDGEVSVGRWIGPLRVLGAARGFSDAYGLGQSKGALAAGAVLKLGRFVALAGDYASVLDRPPGYRDAWSAAVQIAIPYSPHTLSIQATNTNTATLQGSSASRDGQRRYGFEFTIPLTLSRYIPHRQAARPRIDVAALAPVDSDAIADSARAAGVGSPIAPAQTAAPQPAPAGGDSARSARTADTAASRVDSVARGAEPTRVPPRVVRPAPALPGRNTVARVGMREMVFRPLRVEIAAGATVIWTNSDAMVHTVTSDDGRWSSGAIEPGATWRRRFDRPGTYTFHCTPHPFMKGVVVVR
jgi:plastocyanin